MNGEEIIKQLEASTTFTLINREVAEIMLMLHSSDTLNIQDLADKINKCGNLRESLLNNINSGYFKLSKKVNSLSDSIVYLGMNTVEKLIFAHLVKSILPDNLGKSTELSREKYWRHCFGTSIAANLLAEKLNKEDKFKYFAYGLIHDIGTIVLDISFPNIIDEVIKLQQKGIHQIVAEKIVMKGLTHSHLGAWLCEKWNLPKDFRATVEHHHTPLITKDYHEEVAIMSVADSISTLYYERLLSMNTKYVINNNALANLGLTMADVNEISDSLPKKVEETINLFNFQI